SGLSDGERFDAWRALREGRKRVAIGARSAVFAPMRDLGVIVVDEEHESTYKQSDTPRYHARSVAIMRGRIEGCLCVLGSATPALESWENARRGRYRLLELPERVTGHGLPSVELVDLKTAGEDERRDADDAAPGERGPLIFSPRLRNAISARMGRGEQAILLLNRRGYATFVECEACGNVWSCRNCSVTLTYHRRRRRLVCHHCGFEAPPPVKCGDCGAPDPRFTGVGTEQVERRITELFPQARVARMDLDTTGSKWAHAEILDAFRDRRLDLLLGTQMIAKGLDFPGVTLVGVINADVGLHIPDFRASERTFQLLEQVAGRAGRGEHEGEVLVQTSRPLHFALGRAAEHDYVGFADRELADREEPGYPPHRRLANIVLSGLREERVAEAAESLAEWTRSLVSERSVEAVEVVGPAPCAIDRLRDRWRWHFLIKADAPGPLGSVLRALAAHRGRSDRSLRVEIDRDPESLL
ncbi:MAG: primosomal protein N', partial [Gemmatimonadota bacterium]|nr:primosomal protein N' [Gemmatimonadota bacterium]